MSKIMKSAEIQETKNAPLVLLKFEQLAGLSLLLRMPRIPECGDRLRLTFVGDMLMAVFSGWYEVVGREENAHEGNGRSYAIGLEQLPDELPVGNGERCFVVPVR